jgi:hypothetical protein
MQGLEFFNYLTYLKSPHIKICDGTRAEACDHLLRHNFVSKKVTTSLGRIDDTVSEAVSPTLTATKRYVTDCPAVQLSTRMVEPAAEATPPLPLGARGTGKRKALKVDPSIAVESLAIL